MTSILAHSSQQAHGIQATKLGKMISSVWAMAGVLARPQTQSPGMLTSSQPNRRIRGNLSWKNFFLVGSIRRRGCKTAGLPSNRLTFEGDSKPGRGVSIRLRKASSVSYDMSSQVDVHVQAYMSTHMRSYTRTHMCVCILYMCVYIYIHSFTLSGIESVRRGPCGLQLIRKGETNQRARSTGQPKGRRDHRPGESGPLGFWRAV